MIWLIGNKGMLGHDVEESLKKNNIKYCATDIEVDIASLNFLKQYAKNIKFKYIINCAAYTDVDGAETEQEQAYLINGEAVKNLALVAKENDAVLIHISTDYVFDGNRRDLYKEKDTTNPLSVYGKSKLNGEEYIQDILEKYYIFRTAWLYGKYGGNYIYTILRLLHEKKEVKVVNDQFGSPTFTKDLSDVIIKIIKKKYSRYGIYHFTNEGITTWYEYAKEIHRIARDNRLCDREVNIIPVKTEEYPLPAKRPEYSRLSKEKIKKNLKIKIRFWQKALEEFIKNL